MIKNFMKKMKEQKGLTLVELLAVIVILGIIAGIAVPSISGIIENSREDAHLANIEMIESAAQIAAASGIEIGANGYTVGELEAGGFLEEIPVSPWNGATPYNGSVDANGVYVAGTNDVADLNN